MYESVPLRGEKKFQPTPTKQDLGISEGFFSKFPTSSSVLFIREFPRVISIIMILCSYVFVLGKHFSKTWGNSLVAGRPGSATGHKILGEQ